MENLITIVQASKFATELIQKPVSESNISYLIQYGRIDRFNGQNGELLINIEQLTQYYHSYKGYKEISWKQKLGDDVNWQLSFDNYTESETTKHVHRLHPYKGKFIPQLVEYFLDSHTDEFKREVFFQKGDIVLDPFCGSGTTLVQSNELSINAIGIDISEFNTQISNVKLHKYDIKYLTRITDRITELLEEFESGLNVSSFENELLEQLNIFNSKYFPTPEFKKSVYKKEINEKTYSAEKSAEFLPTFYSLAQKYNVSLEIENSTFIGTWYFDTVRKEIQFVNDLINKVDDCQLKALLQVILSRTIRSCRATTHSDLATLLEPVYTTYYCTKHKKICKPLVSILKWWKTYAKDTIVRLCQFDKLRTDTIQHCFTGDSSTINLDESISRYSNVLKELYDKQKIKGVFCSPPYVGLIDYHEQHAYAYELFGFKRNDDLEIGSMSKGYNKTALELYINGISNVLLNCKKYLADDYNVFIVANDKYNLYNSIADRSDMIIVNQYKRPVLNRTEKDKNAYSEIIFQMKEKN